MCNGFVLLVCRSWATSLLCGNGESGWEYNTSFSLFPCLISLTVSTTCSYHNYDTYLLFLPRGTHAHTKTTTTTTTVKHLVIGKTNHKWNHMYSVSETVIITVSEVTVDMGEFQQKILGVWRVGWSWAPFSSLLLGQESSYVMFLYLDVICDGLASYKGKGHVRLGGWGRNASCYQSWLSSNHMVNVSQKFNCTCVSYLLYTGC